MEFIKHIEEYFYSGNFSSIITIISLSSLLFSFILYLFVLYAKKGPDKIQKICKEVKKGSVAFLRAESLRAFLFVSIISILLYYYIDINTAISFITGAVLSTMAIAFSVRTAVKANGRTAYAAKTKGVWKALSISFNSGSVIGISTISLAIIGISVFYYLFGQDLETINAVLGFSLGASITAFFSRIGGGIYTKAAAIGTDLAIKLNDKIPDDDIRNPGIIADNIGDNAGEIAGMSANIFESFVGSIIAAVIIASSSPPVEFTRYLGGTITKDMLIKLPLIIAVIGLLSTLLGMLSLHLLKKLKPRVAIEFSEIITYAIFLISVLTFVLYKNYSNNIFFVIAMGNIGGYLIGKTSNFYTSSWILRKIDSAAKIGTAPTLLTALAMGFRASIIPLFIIITIIFSSFALIGFYGIAISSIGMLAVAGQSIAIEAAVTLSKNAGSISRLAKFPSKAENISNDLEEIFNKTAASERGFAIGSSVLTALSLFIAYKYFIEIHIIEDFRLDILNPNITIGMLIGAIEVMALIALTINSVGKAALKTAKEIERQFKEIPGLLKGSKKSAPDTKTCIRIASRVALNEILIPAFIIITIPVIVGWIFGLEALGGLLAGILISGTIVSLFMTNTGNILDHSKKRAEIKNSKRKKDAIEMGAYLIGDNFGDPLKDTAGPAMNILIKITTIISLIIIPIIIKL